MEKRGKGHISFFLQKCSQARKSKPRFEIVALENENSRCGKQKHESGRKLESNGNRRFNRFLPEFPKFGRQNKIGNRNTIVG